MPCWTPMFLTIFPQEVITTLLWNITIHLGIKNTPWWRNSSVKNCSDKKSGISWNCPHQIVSQLESVWNYVNLTSTLTSLPNSLVTSNRGSSLVSAGPQHISQVVKSHPGFETKYNTNNHTGAMYDIYSVIPEEKRSLVNSPILQMKAIKNEVVALTIWMFLFSFFMTLFYHRWGWMVWWRQWWNDGTIWKFLYKKRYSTGGGEWDDGGPRKG